MLLFILGRCCFCLLPFIAVRCYLLVLAAVLAICIIFSAHRLTAHRAPNRPSLGIHPTNSLQSLHRPAFSMLRSVSLCGYWHQFLPCFASFMSSPAHAWIDELSLHPLGCHPSPASVYSGHAAKARYIILQFPQALGADRRRPRGIRQLATLPQPSL